MNKRYLPILCAAAVALLSCLAEAKGDLLYSAPEKRLCQMASDSLSERAYEKADWVFNHASTVRYEHLHQPAKDQVFCERGNYCEAKDDCSGFISYVLHAVVPRHYEAIRNMQPEHSYPQAKTYAQFFARLAEDGAHDGWVPVNNVRDLTRGDIIAWEKGGAKHDHGGKGNSGHVMMVVDPPTRVQEEMVDGERIAYVSVYVIDSSSVYHFPPESLPPLCGQSHRNGLGKGCIRLVLNQDGRAIGYWEGTYWGEGSRDIQKPSFSQMIHFGRLKPLETAG